MRIALKLMVIVALTCTVQLTVSRYARLKQMREIATSPSKLLKAVSTSQPYSPAAQEDNQQLSKLNPWYQQNADLP
jgi:hypothetical protein